MPAQKQKKTSRSRSAQKAPGRKSKGRARAKFDIAQVPLSVKKSPLKLKAWLDSHIPELIGPRIDSLDPPFGQRGSILTIRGAYFSTNRTDNQVTIGGVSVPVVLATANELRVIVTKDVDSGPVEVAIGTSAATGPHDFTISGYPGGAGDGPPVFAEGAGTGSAGDVNPIGTVRVLVVICQATDVTPTSIASVRSTLTNRWTNVQKFYKQASFNRTDVQFDIVGTAAALDGTFADFVDLAGENNVISGQKNRVAAIAAQHAKDESFNLNNYQMLCAVVFTNGNAIRAWGGVDTQTFSYDDGKPVSDPAHIHIDITLTQPINLLWINEDANWGRFAHEFGHNIVSAPTATGDGTATLGEDVYGSDLVDPDAATAQDFELMGNHDSHPIFSGYHLEKLGYYKPENIREVQWDRNPHSEEVDLVAHALSEDTVANRLHIFKVKISNALVYYIEVRQRPGATAQIFDDSIPIGGAPNQGGVIVTRVIADEMHNNQQTRFITLMHEERVQVQGDFIDDPARALRITVINDAVQTRPLVCRVRVEWAQTIADDPHGSFDLNVEPWDSGFQSPDIWVDRDPIGTFDNPKDGQGRPKGNGDKPWVNHINQFTGRVHVSGAQGASNVKVTFYAVTPPGVGDNGNWSPIGTKTIPTIPKDDFRDIFCNWVPVVGNHTCLKVYASQQLGEISGGNNAAQENVFDFQAAGSSPADPVFIRTAIRNPLEERTAIQLMIRGLPMGWSAQVPHSWLWLDAGAERQVEVMLWPFADVNAYGFGSSGKRKLPGVAPFRVAGHVERNYTEVLSPSAQFPGSRFYPIGGVFYRVGVRKRATIRISLEKGQRKVTTVYGVVGPARANQRILVDVLFPDGKTRRTVETKTGSTGQFTGRVSLLDDDGNVKPGPYQVRAYIFHAIELADAESNVVYALR